MLPVRKFYCARGRPLGEKGDSPGFNGPERPCVRPLYHGRPGHPLMLDHRIVPALKQCSGREGLRGAVEELGLPIQNVEVEDEGTVLDIDTPQDYALLLHKQGGRRCG